jgi:glutathione S-transferase
MILHDFALSSASYRVRIALNLKGLDYETRSYRLRAGDQRGADYIAINPAGLVPTLEIDGRIITQSLAIIDYLDATRVCLVPQVFNARRFKIELGSFPRLVEVADRAAGLAAFAKAAPS